MESKNYDQEVVQKLFEEISLNIGMENQPKKWVKYGIVKLGKDGRVRIPPKIRFWLQYQGIDQFEIWFSDQGVVLKPVTKKEANNESQKQTQNED